MLHHITVMEPILDTQRLTNGFALFGCIVAALYCLKLLAQIIYAFWLFTVPSNVHFPSLGRWAVVTGATDGIGKAYCRELAQRGMDVVVVGRNEEKLKRCVEEFSTEFPERHFRSVTVDFGASDEDIYDHLHDQTKDLEVGVLVNNVGVAYKIPARMHELNGDFLRDIMRINMVSTARCTHLYLPQMVARNRGAIINISSSSSYLTIPLMAMYASTKSFVSAFSRNLAAEYRNTGITFLCLTPYVVATKLAADHQDVSQTSLTLPSPSTYAHNSLAFVGKCKLTHGHIGHSLQSLITKNLIPECVSVYLTELILKKTAAEAIAEHDPVSSKK